MTLFRIFRIFKSQIIREVKLSPFHNFPGKLFLLFGFICKVKKIEI